MARALAGLVITVPMAAAHLGAEALRLTTVLLPDNFDRARKSCKARVADTFPTEWITHPITRTELPILAETRTHFAGTVTAMVLLRTLAYTCRVITCTMATAILGTNFC